MNVQVCMTKPENDFEPIAELSMEGVASRAFLESVQMRLYDRLQRPQTATQVAAAFALNECAAEAFLDLLAARGLLSVSEDRYSNSPVSSEYLVSTSPFYQGDCIELHQKPVARLLQEMTVLLRRHGTVQEPNAQAPVDRRVLAGIAQYSMRGGLQDTVQFISTLPEFSEMRSMCDVGGSHGRYATALLDRNPHLRAVVVDLPSVVPASTEICRDADYADRLSVLACDLRTDTLPQKAYDLVLASHVLYPLSDTLELVVSTIADSLKPGGWFVSHHLDPASEACRRFRTAVDLTTCLMGNVRHLLPQAMLESAMRAAGLSVVKSGRAGYRAENLLLAAQRKP